jgi:murein DD-endopeptidase MepM/ murein hydrolase activator NlpD
MIEVMAIARRLPRLSLAWISLFLAVAARLPAGDGEYPLILSLTGDDIIYRQISSDVEAFHYAEAHRASGAARPPLTLFRFRPGPNDDISSVAARLSITQATLATLNRVSSPAAFRALKEVIVSNIPGIFLPDKPASELEQSLGAARAKTLASAVPVVMTRAGSRVSGRFVAGDDFSPQELASFFRGFFRAPLSSGRISSRFGIRTSPFDGGTGLHGGIDIVAPKGTPVAAAQSGLVTEVGANARYGKYVVLSHDSSYQTLYAHLDTVAVGLRDQVDSGTMLGTVGDSGLTTGAHLHFEIRRKGVAVDPLSYLPATWSRR